ncbi:unnamed protein product, partial [Amoebophrya sp. A25]|eukprot:GSA25T00021880001.1
MPSVLSEKERERALVSWEEALDRGLHKIKKSASTLSSQLKPPKSLFEPKASRVRYSWLPEDDESDVGPSASVMAYLTERYRRERLKLAKQKREHGSAVSANDYGGSSVSSSSLTSTQLRSAIDNLPVFQQDSMEREARGFLDELTGGKSATGGGSSSSSSSKNKSTTNCTGTRDPRADAADSVTSPGSGEDNDKDTKFRVGKSDLLAVSSNARRDVSTRGMQAVIGTSSSSTSCSASRSNVDAKLDAALQQKAELLLEGKKKGRRPLSSTSRNRPSSMDLVGLADIDAQFANLPPIIGDSQHGANLRKDKAAIRDLRSSTEKNVEEKPRIRMRLKPEEMREDPGTTKCSRAEKAQSHYAGSSLLAAKSNAAVLEGRGRRERRKSQDLGLRGRNRSNSKLNAGRCLKDADLKREIAVQNWMG